MAFLSSILAISQPSGAWIGIIKAFEGALGNYVLAIILLTLIIRVLWTVVDTFQKYTQQKMNKVQSQMQPEMEKLEAKYAKQPQILQQKKNELQQRYMGKSQIGSCVVMLVVTVLNLVIFFTLFGGLNTMASYKIASNYDNLKYTYANCLNVTNEYFGDTIDQAELDEFKNFDNLKFVINVEGENKTISLVKVDGQNETVLASTAYKDQEAFTTKITVPAEEEGGQPTEKEVTNQNILALIHKYFPVDAEGNYDETKDILLHSENVVDEEGNPVLDEEGNIVVEKLYLSEAIQAVAMKNIAGEYDATKESFLWIENIWVADSPFEQSILGYKSVASQIGKKNLEENEEQIYNAFMSDLKEQKSTANGFFIIPILCVLVSILSMYITTLYNNNKNRKKGLPQVKKNAKWAQFIMPAVLGLFALFYNSVFAVYMLTGQIVSAALLPLQLIVIDKIMEKKEKKEEEKNVTIDYTRKF